MLLLLKIKMGKVPIALSETGLGLSQAFLSLNELSLKVINDSPRLIT
jgi:hypothetical protein